MIDQETIPVGIPGREGSRPGLRAVHPAGLLRFFPIADPPTIDFVTLAPSPTTIGRSPDCRLRLDDDRASRVHARVERMGQQWRVVDNNSTNGVFVNGERVESQLLEGGEIIRLGSTLLRFIACGTAGHDTQHAVDTTFLPGGPALEPIRELIRRAADSDISVLLAGETGTGKELAAQRLHDMGKRARGPFVPVNCSAIPQSMVESELFGHVKGAFTGATESRAGLIAQSSGGTLFLDEIGELPLESQAKLLRVLQDHTVRPVGGTRTTPVDMRVVCATNRNLRHFADDGGFRHDLYARVSGLVIQLPPLRARLEDVPVLVRHFIGKYGDQQREVTIEGMETLCCQSWPFNVRQLESSVRRALLMAGEADALDADHFIDPDAEQGAPEHPGSTAMRSIGPPPVIADDPQARELIDALSRNDGDVIRTADELGISRSQLYRRAKKCGINIGMYRA